MSLFKKISNIMKPKWENEDPEIRRQAVIEIPEKSIDHLASVVLNENDEDIAIIALKKINDIDTLYKVIQIPGKPKLTNKAEKKLQQLLRKAIVKNNRIDLIQAIADEKALVDIVIEAENDEAKNIAFEKLTEEDSFYKIAKNAGNSPYAIKSLEYIVNEQFLRDLRHNAKYGKLRKAASEKFEKIYSNAAIKAKKSQTKDIDYSNELELMSDYVERLLETNEFDKFSKVIAEKVELWSEYDPYGASEFAPRFYNAVKLFEERKKIHEEQLAEEARKNQFQKDLTSTKNKLCLELENLIIDSETLDRIKDLRKIWIETYSLNDEDAENKFQNRFNKIADKQKEKVAKFFEEKEKFNIASEKIATCEEILKTNNINEIKNIQKNLPNLKFFRVYDKDKIEELKKRIENIKKHVKDFIFSYDENIKENNEKLFSELKMIIEQIPPLIEMENRNEAFKTMRDLQQKWKDLKGDSIEPLAKKYKKLSDQFWIKQKGFYEEQEWDRWANKESKNALIRIVEKTAELSDLRKVAEIIRKAQQKWKEFGPVPKEDSEKMWSRFHKACEDNYARCIKFFEELDKKRQENLVYCKSIIERANDAAKIEDIPAALKLFKELGLEWKAHADLPKPDGDALYKNFRQISDDFFNKYGEFRQELDSHREENQQKREEIIAKIEKLVSDGVDDIKQCIALQKELYALGPGLKEKEAETRKAFRDASDAFFETIDKNREKNIPLKEKLCEELEAITPSDEDRPSYEIINKVYDIQRKWRKIGPLPKKQENDLWQRLKKTCMKLLKMNPDTPPVELKNNIANEAASMANSTQWRETTQHLRYLQAQWNIIGHTTEADDDLWTQFRNACDSFFNNKKNHFEKMDSQRDKNLIEKEGLIARIEILARERHSIEETKETETANNSISLADELKMAIENNFVVSSISGSGMNDEVRRIQEQWKKIGHVPRDKDNDLWTRYKKALDMFYGGGEKS